MSATVRQANMHWNIMKAACGRFPARGAGPAMPARKT